MAVPVTLTAANEYSLNVNKSFSSQSEPMNDVVFVIGKDKTRFHGIKALFAMHSPIFKSMFYNGNFYESQASECEIEIEDVTVIGFQYLRDYCYGLKPILNFEDVADVLYCAKKYMLKGVENDCKLSLNNFVPTLDDLDQILQTLVKLHNFGLKQELSQLSGVLSLSNTLRQQLIRTQRILSLPSDIVQIFLKSDTFGCKESIIYQKCVEWARFQHKLNLQKTVPKTDYKESDFSVTIMNFDETELHNDGITTSSTDESKTMEETKIDENSEIDTTDIISLNESEFKLDLIELDEYKDDSYWSDTFDYDSIFTDKNIAIDEEMIETKPELSTDSDSLQLIFEHSCRASRFSENDDAWRRRGSGTLELYFNVETEMLILEFTDNTFDKLRLHQRFYKYFDFEMEFEDDDLNTVTWRNTDYVMAKSPVTDLWKLRFKDSKPARLFLNIVKSYYYGQGLPGLSNSKVSNDNMAMDEFEVVDVSDISDGEMKYLKLLKDSIRFPIMDKDYFNRYIIESGLLTTQECLDLFRYWQTPDLESVKKKIGDLWCCKERCCVDASAESG